MFASLIALSKLFELLNDVLLQGSFNPEVVDQVTESIKSCKGGIKKLRSNLIKAKGFKPGLNARLRRFQYAFRENTLVKLLATVSNLRDNLNLAVNALNLDTISKLLPKLSILDAKVDAVTSTSNASSADILARLTTFRDHQEQQAPTPLQPDILDALNIAIDALGHRSVTTLQTLVDLNTKVESMMDISQDKSAEISEYCGALAFVSLSILRAGLFQSEA